MTVPLLGQSEAEKEADALQALAHSLALQPERIPTAIVKILIDLGTIVATLAANGLLVQNEDGTISPAEVPDDGAA